MLEVKAAVILVLGQVIETLGGSFRVRLVCCYTERKWQTPPLCCVPDPQWWLEMSTQSGEMRIGKRN